MRAGRTPNDSSGKVRQRGRPVKSESEQAELRNRILDATAAAYGELGYHALTVQAILEKAGLSRPTFYRYFANCDEPVRIIIAAAHADLVDRLVNQVPQDADIEEKMARAVALYLDWGKSIGPLLRPLYIELHDPRSPVSELRPQVLSKINDIYTKMLQASGFSLQSPLFIELMITGIEFLGYRYHFQQSAERVTRTMINEAIKGLMVSTIAQSDSLSMHPKPRSVKRKT
jgi:AcrR family transcriptional regulator